MHPEFRQQLVLAQRADWERLAERDRRARDAVPGGFHLRNPLPHLSLRPASWRGRTATA